MVFLGMRKSYGNTWWGKQWLNALANIDYSNRLPRGRTYANKGLARDIEIEGNKISAFVQGSRPSPYKVYFIIPKFSVAQKAQIIEFITSNPIFLSKLLNRKLPQELRRICNQKDIPLFPNSWQDIKGNCSCPDWAVPCKHMAAVLYLIANEIDKNPFLIFQLHDFDLFQSLEKAGYTSQGQKEVHITDVESLRQPFTALKEITEWDEEIYEQLDFTRIPDCLENLLTILSENPVFYPEGDFKKLLHLAYTAIAKVKIDLNSEDIEEKQIREYDNIEDVELLLDTDLEFLDVTFRNNKGKKLINFESVSGLMKYLAAAPAADFQKYSDTFKSLILAQRLAIKLAQRSAIIPQLLHIENEYYRIRWIPALLNTDVRSIVDGVKSILRTDLVFFKSGKTVEEPTERNAVITLLSAFLNEIVAQNHRLDYRFAEREIGHLFFNGAVLSFDKYETKNYPTAIQLWLDRFYIVEKDFVPLIIVDEDEEQGFWVNIAVQQKSKRQTAPIPLHAVLTEKRYSDLRINLLRNLALLSDYFPTINDLVERRGEEDLYFGAEEFVEVLFRILPTIRLFGIKVLLPKSLRKLLRPRMSMTISMEPKDKEPVNKNTTTLLGLSQMLAFKWKVAIGDQVFSESAFIDMVQKYAGIVKLNDQYVIFDEQEIETLIKQLKNPPKVDAKILFKTALTEEYDGAPVELDAEARRLLDELLRPDSVAPPGGLRATLRPYQRTGYEWLYKNSRIGVGSLIADDMGLGKTLQVITTLLKLKEDGSLDNQKALIIVPTTLLTNWQKEMNKFAPVLRTLIYHGPKRALKSLDDTDILLTTYGVARTDGAKLRKFPWLLVAIDEAQNIKNPNTAQTKAIKKIQAPVRIAMSGTPVENRLIEYWSILDFTNSGYLSSLSKFKEEFAKPIEVDRDQTQLERFRKITEPFILRRLKSDKSIIKDLPDKIEKDQFCQLSPEQTAIYQNVIDTTLRAVDEADGIKRKGLVLKLLTALKQICNHPAQYLKESHADPERSGKVLLLFDLLRPILNNGEKTLIFTQYQEMGKLLAKMLDQEFGLQVPFLHGGVSRKKRDEMVEDFQHNRATRIMILSLKAGGTGLNLTAANNVIHFDLWWNPAVEAQATDRAYRIGQMKNVMVHRFITQGTFEEKINNMLLQKRELANLTVSTGEKWIGELSGTELKEIVKLG
jgi:SNF2 family DNA or RNA helicase